MTPYGTGYVIFRLSSSSSSSFSSSAVLQFRCPSLSFRCWQGRLYFRWLRAVLEGKESRSHSHQNIIYDAPSEKMGHIRLLEFWSLDDYCTVHFPVTAPTASDRVIRSRVPDFNLQGGPEQIRYFFNFMLTYGTYGHYVKSSLNE